MRIHSLLTKPDAPGMAAMMIFYALIPLTTAAFFTTVALVQSLGLVQTSPAYRETAARLAVGAIASLCAITDITLIASWLLGIAW